MKQDTKLNVKATTFAGIMFLSGIMDNWIMLLIIILILYAESNEWLKDRARQALFIFMAYALGHLAITIVMQILTVCDVTGSVYGILSNIQTFISLLKNIALVLFAVNALWGVTYSAETPFFKLNDNHESNNTEVSRVNDNKKNCKKCGTELKKDAAFCVKCGTRVEKEEE